MNARSNLSSWTIVPPESIEHAWPMCEEGVARALASSNGEATVEDTKAGLVAGRTQLFLSNGIGGYLGMVFQILAFPRYKILRVLLAFGRNIPAVEECYEAGRLWAKANGCRYLECWVATESRVRLFKRFGFEKTYTILRSEL